MGGNQADSQPEIQKHTRLLKTKKIRTREGMGSFLQVCDIASRDLVGWDKASFQSRDMAGHDLAGSKSRDMTG